MREKVLIAIAVTEAETKDVLYAINMALAQSYEPVELLISYNWSAAVDDNKIVEVIESNKKSELQNIRINAVKENHSASWHYDFAFIYAKERGINYVCFMSNGDCFYDSNSLELIVSGK